MHSLDIVSYFKGIEAEIIERIRDIVEVESPSGDVERSHAVCDLVEEVAEASGVDLSLERVHAEGLGEHLVIQAFPQRSKPVLLLGHTDTVHPVGSKVKNPTRIEGGKLYGCGVFDMKANVVLMLEVLRWFSANKLGPTCPITIILSCDEEIGSPTGRALIEREAANAAYCLVLEPSAAGRVKTGRKGTGMYTVSAHGAPAHAGLEPEKGASAILELARQIEIIHRLNAPEIGTTVNVCTVNGGTTMNVIPEYATCSVDVRFSTLSEAERIDDALHSLTAANGRVKLEVLGSINRPPLERTQGVIDLFEKARQVAAEFEYPLAETQVGGASDGNFVAALGVPVLDGLGITGDGAHTLEEHILVGDIVNRATLITRLLLDRQANRD